MEEIQLIDVAIMSFLFGFIAGGFLLKWMTNTDWLLSATDRIPIHFCRKRRFYLLEGGKKYPGWLVEQFNEDI